MMADATVGRFHAAAVVARTKKKRNEGDVMQGDATQGVEITATLLVLVGYTRWSASPFNFDVGDG